MGNKVNSTYPKRAKGLVKSGRAVFVGEADNEIRLLQPMMPCPPINLEDEMSDINKLTFDARKWQADTTVPDRNKNRAERAFVNDMCGGLTEVYCVGNWNKDWSQIESPRYNLEKGQDYIFSFWLNGGENDRFQEFCTLRIVFDDNWDNAMAFKLNRNYIKPAKHNSGWYLYEIPFNTGNSGFTQFKLSVMDAYCAIMPDKPEFAQLPDEEKPDPRIPQRHNIVFAEGFPRNSGWSYLVFGEGSQNSDNNRSNGSWANTWSNNWANAWGNGFNGGNGNNGSMSFDDSIRESIHQSFEEAFDNVDLEEIIREHIFNMDLSGIIKEHMDEAQG